MVAASLPLWTTISSSFSSSSVMERQLNTTPRGRLQFDCLFTANDTSARVASSGSVVRRNSINLAPYAAVLRASRPVIQKGSFALLPLLTRKGPSSARYR